MKQWVSAQELAGVAGLSRNDRNIRRMAEKEGWPTQTRPGRAKEKEYAYASLPQGVQAALALRWWATEVEDDKGVMQKAKDGTSSHIQHAWANYALLKNPSKAKAQHRMAALMALQTLQANGQTLKQAIAALRAQGAVPNRSTVFRWLKSVHGVPQPHWLPFLGSKFTGGNQPAHCPPEIWDFFKSDYLRLERPAAKACYRRAKQVAAKAGLEIPSLDTFARRLKQRVSPQVIALARGGGEALSKTIPAQKRSVADLFALALVCGDGHRFDVFTKWAEIEKPVRPMLLGLQDVYSRKILAWRIGLNENTALVRLAFADLLRDWADYTLLKNHPQPKAQRGQPARLCQQMAGALTTASALKSSLRSSQACSPCLAAKSTGRSLITTPPRPGWWQGIRLFPFHGVKGTCPLAGVGQRSTNTW